MENNMMDTLVTIVSKKVLKDILISCFKTGSFPDEREKKDELAFLAEKGLLKKDKSRFRLTQAGEVIGYNLAEWDLQIEHGGICPFIEKMGINSRSVLVDIGCGGGQTLLACLKYDPSFIYGFDKDPLALKLAEAFQKNAGRDSGYYFQTADALSLPLDENTCTHVIFSGVLQKLDQHMALKEVDRVLGDGGVFLIHTLGAGYYLNRLFCRKPTAKNIFITTFSLFNGIVFILLNRKIKLGFKGKIFCEGFLYPAKLIRAMVSMGWTVDNIDISRFLLLPYSIKITGRKNKS